MPAPLGLPRMCYSTLLYVVVVVSDAFKDSRSTRSDEKILTSPQPIDSLPQQSIVPLIQRSYVMYHDRNTPSFTYIQARGLVREDFSAVETDVFEDG